MYKIFADGWKRLDKYIEECRKLSSFSMYDELISNIYKIIKKLDKNKFYTYEFIYNKTTFILTFYIISNDIIFIDLYNLTDVSRDVEIVIKNKILTSQSKKDSDYKIAIYGINKLLKELDD